MLFYKSQGDTNMNEEQSRLLLGSLEQEDVNEIKQVTSAIGVLMERLDELNAEEQKLTDELDSIKEQKRTLVEELIPEFMTNNGLSEIKLADGRKLSYKEEYFTHVSEANKPKAWAWFREHGFEDIIKSRFNIVYTAGQTDKVLQCKEVLAEHNIDYTVKEDVHSSTLKSVVNRLIADGNMPPQDLFGIYQKKSAVVKKK